MPTKIRENGPWISLVSGILLLVFTSIYNSSFNSYEKLSKCFVPKEMYEADKKDTARRLERIEDKIDALLSQKK